MSDALAFSCETYRTLIDSLEVNEIARMQHNKGYSDSDLLPVTCSPEIGPFEAVVLTWVKRLGLVVRVQR